MLWSLFNFTFVSYVVNSPRIDLENLGVLSGLESGVAVRAPGLKNRGLKLWRGRRMGSMLLNVRGFGLWPDGVVPAAAPHD